MVYIECTKSLVVLKYCLRYVLLQVLVTRGGEEGQNEVRADTGLPLRSVGEPEDLGVRAVPVVQEHHRRQSSLHRILIVIIRSQ